MYYFGARYYDPNEGRWWGVDPLAEKYMNLSPYVYVFNNPIKFVDPKGLEGEDPNKAKTTTDAGHGDKPKGARYIDPGAVDGKNYEKDFALKVENEIDKCLKEFGIENQRTRSGDVELPNNNRVEWRYKLANQNGSTVFVSIHLDSGDREGMFIIYRSEEGKKLAASILKNVNVLKAKNDGMMQDVRGLGVLKGFKGNAAVLIELGGIQNANTLNTINTNAFQIGKEIAQGIYAFLNNGQLPSQVSGKIQQSNWLFPQPIRKAYPWDFPIK